MVFEVMGGNMFLMNIDGTNLTDLGKGIDRDGHLTVRK